MQLARKRCNNERIMTSGWRWIWRTSSSNADDLTITPTYCSDWPAARRFVIMFGVCPLNWPQFKRGSLKKKLQVVKHLDQKAVSAVLYTQSRSWSLWKTHRTKRKAWLRKTEAVVIVYLVKRCRALSSPASVEQELRRHRWWKTAPACTYVWDQDTEREANGGTFHRERRGATDMWMWPLEKTPNRKKKLHFPPSFLPVLAVDWRQRFTAASK